MWICILLRNGRSGYWRIRQMLSSIRVIPSIDYYLRIHIFVNIITIYFRNPIVNSWGYKLLSLLLLILLIDMILIILRISKLIVIFLRTRSKKWSFLKRKCLFMCNRRRIHVSFLAHVPLFRLRLKNKIFLWGIRYPLWKWCWLLYSLLHFLFFRYIIYLLILIGSWIIWSW